MKHIIYPCQPQLTSGYHCSRIEFLAKNEKAPTERAKWNARHVGKTTFYGVPRTIFELDSACSQHTTHISADDVTERMKWRRRKKNNVNALFCNTEKHCFLWIYPIWLLRQRPLSSRSANFRKLLCSLNTSIACIFHPKISDAIICILSKIMYENFKQNSDFRASGHD